MGNSSSNTTNGEQSSSSSNSNDPSITATPVYLHVYKPSSADEPENKFTKSLINATPPGFGIWHTGVEVYGAEYIFVGGGTSSTGIISQKPKFESKESPWEFKETVLIGHTNYTKPQIQGIITELKPQWAQKSYDLTSRNCNHFSDDFCKKITVENKGVPAWVNRAAKVGNVLKKVVGDFVKEADENNSGPPLQAMSPVTEYVDLVSEIEIDKIGCLNEQKDFPAIPIFKQVSTGVFAKKKEVLLESDCDEELLLFIPFKHAVKIQSILITGPEGFAPKSVKLFANKKNLDFNDVKSLSPTQVVTFTAEQTKGDGVAVPLKFVSFQNVSDLVIFVESNQGGKDTTKIKLLRLVGVANSATDMKNLKEVSRPIQMDD